MRGEGHRVASSGNLILFIYARALWLCVCVCVSVLDPLYLYPPPSLLDGISPSINLMSNRMQHTLPSHLAL